MRGSLSRPTGPSQAISGHLRRGMKGEASLMTVGGPHEELRLAALLRNGRRPTRIAGGAVAGWLCQSRRQVQAG
ncbi:hypothetical protein NDU88_004323 [Pleurodeles waltl]|uniref:Uncharacterized protein n=1 Tax=Pleurodeles waltl TaxID=8319 RepID=A0AAV7M7W8_PLEWA|nr:hypothetical protein NDU88_004323 [Pleurodeles waltl]